MATITCKAMVQWENGADLVEETIQVAPPKAGEVRLKVLASGVCHTDWSEPRNFPSSVTPKGSDKPGFPVILGHEGGGIVESVGQGVTSLKVGDYVIPLYISECRACENCMSRKTNLCSANEDTQSVGLHPDGTTRFSVTKGGKTIEILQFMGCSTFAEYTVCPEVALAKISQDAPLEKVCLLGCGITTGYGAVHNTIKVEARSKCAVFGLGGVGLAVVMALKEAGASTIIGVDTNPAKEAIGRSFGITHFVNPKTIKEGDTVEGTVWQTNGGGLDYTFECIGNPKIMAAAVACLHEGWGKACVIGVAPPGQEVTIRPFQLVVGKTWTGSAFGGTRGRTQLPQYVNSYMAGQPPFVDPFVTFTLPHTEVNEAFHLMHDGKSLRSIITFPHTGDAEVAAHRAKHKQGQKASALVFLHGLGSSPADWQGAADWLASKIPGLRTVLPAAPSVPITKSKGEKMPAWFDVFEDWPKPLEGKDDDKGLAASVRVVHAILDGLVAEGVPPERIVVAGFSQGAVLSALSTYQYSQTLGGCIMLSGWVPSRASFSSNVAPANKATPCFWGHGDKDDIVPIAHQQVGFEVLSKAAIPTTTHGFGGVGHDSSEEEMDLVLAFLRSRLA